MCLKHGKGIDQLAFDDDSNDSDSKNGYDDGGDDDDYDDVDDDDCGHNVYLPRCLSTKALVESCDELEPRGGRCPFCFFTFLPFFCLFAFIGGMSFFCRMNNPRPGRTYECEDICRSQIHPSKIF